MKDYRLTERLQRVISLAEKELKLSGGDVLHPIHIFIAVLKENTAVLEQLRLNHDIDIDKFKSLVNKTEYKEKGHVHPFFECEVSESVLVVIKKAETLMHKYGQIYLNEGHIIRGILITDNRVSKSICADKKEAILNVTASSRDLAVSLRNYILPPFNQANFRVRRAKKSDDEKLYNFIITEFNKGWADNVKEGLIGDAPPIFIAVLNDEIIGFGAYDVVRKRKGLFGPMGVKKEQRANNIGYAVLHKCLEDMNAVGYEYAIINDAGPIEFYEKSCGAVIIYG